MSNVILLDTKEDINWLRDVHLPTLPKAIKSAILYGNSDYPTKVEAWNKRKPKWDATPDYHWERSEEDC